MPRTTRSAIGSNEERHDHSVRPEETCNQSQGQASKDEDRRGAEGPIKPHPTQRAEDDCRCEIPPYAGELEACGPPWPSSGPWFHCCEFYHNTIKAVKPSAPCAWRTHLSKLGGGTVAFGPAQCDKARVSNPGLWCSECANDGSLMGDAGQSLPRSRPRRLRSWLLRPGPQGQVGPSGIQ